MRYDDQIETDFSLPFKCSVVAFFLATLYYLARLGFEDGLKNASGALALCFILLNTPEILRKCIFPSKETWWKSRPLLFLGVLLSLVFLGFLTPHLRFSIRNFALTMGFGSFVYCAFLSFEQNRASSNAPRWFTLLLVSVWMAGCFWGTHYRDPLFVEQLCLGLTPKDTLFHTSITQMMSTYGVASTGLDGVIPIHYHIGSHWIFLQLSRLIGMPMIDFYQVGFPVLFGPIFVLGLFELAAAVRRLYRPPLIAAVGTGEWLLVLIITMGLFPPMVTRATWSDNMIMNSESFFVASTLMYFFLAAVLDLMEKDRLAFAAVFVPAGLMALSAIKVTHAYFLMLVFLYFLIINGWYKKGLYVSVFLAATVLLMISYKMVSSPFHSPLSGSNDPFHVFKETIAPTYRFVYPFVKYFWSVLFLLIAFILQRSSKDRFWKAEIEIILIMVVGGFIPLFLFHLDSFWAIYFLSLHQYFALAFFVARYPQLYALVSAKWANLRRSSLLIPVAALGLLIAYSMVLTFSYRFFFFANKNVLTRRDALGPGLANTPYYDIISSLKSISALDVKEKRESLIYISPSVRHYWTMSQMCGSIPFVAPAISGVALLNGFDPSCNDYINFSYAFYPRAHAPNEIVWQSKADLCSEVNQNGFKRVFVMLEEKNRVSLADVPCPT